MSASLIILGSAARTVETSGPSMDGLLGASTNTAAVMLIVDLSASGGAISLTPAVQVKEPSGGAWVDYWVAAAAIVATGQYIYELFQRTDILLALPTVTGTLKEALHKPVNGAEWRFVMKVGNANSQTYSVGGYWLYLL